MSGGGENVKFIFKNALLHYNQALEELKNDKEPEFSNAITQEVIEENVTKINQIITDLDSTDWQYTIERHRELLCGCLRGYISNLEVSRSSIITKLQGNLSLPVIDLSRIDNELELAKVILKKSCEDQEL